MTISNNLSINLFSVNKNSDRSALSRSIRRLEQDVLRMGTLVEESFRLACQCLFDRNLDAVKKIAELEARIDEYYRQIESDCVNIIALKTPVARDLRLLSAYMQLIIDLERIGDYAEEISQIAVKLFSYPAHDCLSEIEEMSDRTQLMLATSLLALTDMDVSTASNLKTLDNIIDKAYDRLYQVLAYQKDIKGVVEPILLLGLLICHLEKTASHAANIGERVSFIVTGERN